jgi:hypothetical protein
VTLDAARCQLTPDELARWHRDGWLLIPQVFRDSAITELRRWVDDVAARRPITPGAGGVLQHYERTATGAALARSERLVELHDGWRTLLDDGALPAMAAALLAEPAVLYKEKINYKLAGGAGFAAHQDAPAYPFVDTHPTVMVAIDDATIDNGCLEVVSGMHADLLALDDDGCIRSDVAAGLDFRPLAVRAGDVVWFHSRAPHRSGRNDSDLTRRALFCTYNAARLGDLRTAYYDHKLAYFAEHGASTARLSTIGDFQGVAPTDEELREIGVLP